MADVSKDQLNELVARATKNILEEMRAGESKAFAVGELQTHLVDLAKINQGSAWEITYKTSHAGIETLPGSIRPGAGSAWEISYKTSAATFDRESMH